MNRSAYDFCRWAAATALVYAVIDGMANREAVLEFFSTLFTGQEAEADSAFWDGLASSIYHLYPEELMGAIEKAYADDLISPGMIGPKDFERTLALGKEKTLQRTRTDMKQRMKDNIHDEMSWWACFTSPSVDLRPKESFDGQTQQKSKPEKQKQAKPLQQAKPSQSQPARSTPKVGRNAPCPCGSGKKYKKCCLGASSVAPTG